MFCKHWQNWKHRSLYLLSVISSRKKVRDGKDFSRGYRLSNFKSLPNLTKLRIILNVEISDTKSHRGIFYIILGVPMWKDVEGHQCHPERKRYSGRHNCLSTHWVLGWKQKLVNVLKDNFPIINHEAIFSWYSGNSWIQYKLTYRVWNYYNYGTLMYIYEIMFLYTCRL